MHSSRPIGTNRRASMFIGSILLICPLLQVCNGFSGTPVPHVYHSAREVRARNAFASSFSSRRRAPSTVRYATHTPVTNDKKTAKQNRSADGSGTGLSRWKDESRFGTPASDIEEFEKMVDKEGNGLKKAILPLGIAAALAAAAGVAQALHLDLPSISEASHSVELFFADPTSTLEAVVQSVQEMGPLGFLYFGVVYTVAEILAIPAIPLTASAGYLFGVTEGTAIVLLSASIAAAVSFVIGRTFLRSYVEGVLEDFPKFKKIDKAIGKEGFKLMLLLRVSPVFPFALSNYLYGATSVRFWPYFFGTMIGFTPGTIAYVATGEVGKALTIGGAGTQPWYIYAGGFAFLGAFLKFAADTATSIIDELEEEE